MLGGLSEIGITDSGAIAGEGNRDWLAVDGKGDRSCIGLCCSAHLRPAGSGDVLVGIRVIGESTGDDCSGLRCGSRTLDRNCTVGSRHVELKLRAGCCEGIELCGSLDSKGVAFADVLASSVDGEIDLHHGANAELGRTADARKVDIFNDVVDGCCLRSACLRNNDVGQCEEAREEHCEPRNC